MTYTKEVQSPRGVSVEMHARDDTSDLATIGSTWRLWGTLHDEYGLADIHSDGVMLDVGAHIGSVCIAFLVDNPEARAIAVEPLPENIEMIVTNAESAGVTDRLSIVHGALGTDSVQYGPDVHRYISNIGGADGERITVPNWTLSELVNEPIDVLKVDCEGGEWDAFADPAISRCRLIVGEYHGKPKAALRRALTKTHAVTILTESGSTGTFKAVRRG